MHCAFFTSLLSLVKNLLSEQIGKHTLNHRRRSERHFIHQQQLSVNKSVSESPVLEFDLFCLIVRDHHIAKQLLSGRRGAEVVSHKGNQRTSTVLFHCKGFAGRRHSFNHHWNVVLNHILHDLVSDFCLFCFPDKRRIFLHGDHMSIGFGFHVFPILSI